MGYSLAAPSPLVRGEVFLDRRGKGSTGLKLSDDQKLGMGGGPFHFPSLHGARFVPEPSTQFLGENAKDQYHFPQN